MAMLIILSPSKTIEKVLVKNVPYVTQPQFVSMSSELVKVLQLFSLDELKEFLSVSLPLAKLNFERYMKWSVPFTSENSHPAILSFKGDVYEGIDVTDFSAEDLRFAHDSLRILSGLYGVLRPLDLMHPYRLEMGSGLRTKNAKNLYDYWTHTITKSLNSELATAQNPVLLNLASMEYFKCVNVKALQAKVITPEFKEHKNGGYVTVAIHAKRARGLVSRFIVKNRIVDVEQVKLFDNEGYYFQPDLSDERRWVFVR